MTQSLEDYIEAIFVLSEKTGVTRVKDVADKIGVSRPSVIQALKQLHGRELIQQEHYGYIQMTEEGRQVAREIMKKHHVLKQFLLTLGVSIEIAERDACRMEHILHSETIKAIEVFLKKGGEDAKNA